MIKFIPVLLLSFSSTAQQVMTEAKLTSCNILTCTKLVSQEIHRSNISPNIMAFGEATVDIYSAIIPDKHLQSFKAGDGYYDMEEQVLVLRDLRASKHKELVYNLATNAISYF